MIPRVKPEGMLFGKTATHFSGSCSRGPEREGAPRPLSARGGLMLDRKSGRQGTAEILMLAGSGDSNLLTFRAWNAPPRQSRDGILPPSRH
jgi:hypothetical protein